MVKDSTGALADYGKAIALQPNDTDPIFNRAILKRKLKDYNGAVEDCSRVIAINPSDDGAYNNMGKAKFGLGDKKSAPARPGIRRPNSGNKYAPDEIKKNCN